MELLKASQNGTAFNQDFGDSPGSGSQGVSWNWKCVGVSWNWKCVHICFIAENHM